MSHFTVLVVGDDVEAQLAPFHEYECTGLNNQYVQEVDRTDEIRQSVNEKGLTDGLAYHGLKDRVVSDESEIDRDGAHKWGYVVIKDGQLIKAVRRTNPNAKWDWYQIGGRWMGFYRLKNGDLTKGARLGSPGVLGNEAKPGCADQCRKSDVDVAGMRDHNGQEAGARWDKVRAALGDLTGFVPWPRMLEKHGDENIGAARNEYHAQAAIKRKNEASEKDRDLVWITVGDYLCTREAYVQQARDAALIPFAYLKDGAWHERGGMGWFGCVSDEKDRDAWMAEFNTMFDALPDDTLLTIVDCHI